MNCTEQNHYFYPIAGVAKQGMPCICGKTVYEEKKEIAKRVSHSIRYDILDPEFLECMAMVADYGAKKYGEYNWQLSRLDGDKSPINHIYKHLKSLRMDEPYDHKEIGETKKWHCIAIAFNAMMEFWWLNKEEKESK
jgi:Domain of unknown function (DUF5664)